ncbi:MAG: glycine--tRNA ligase subunit beta [Azoarcus sp.]|jgi:glycyl-tRNA synthetase beta chain|nr:glycine--tRNA ligase subunit beta [Azoarcus sp.]
MTICNLLVEIFVEELPPKVLKTLGETFAAALADALRRDGLAAADAVVTAYATPRRLAAHITGVLAVAEDKPVTHKLMPVAVGLDATGSPTPALLKKLSTLGLTASVLPRLRRERDGKAESLFYDSLARGATLAEGLQAALDVALAALPIPKVMRYQLADGWTSVDFVRPAHALVALHGEEIVPVSVLGLQAGRATHGHRFEALVDPIDIPEADAYAATLRDKGAVIASFAARRAEIARQLADAAARAGADLHPVEDEALLDEVTALVERPNVLVGEFEREFLDVPQECLILTMKANQKYFPLLDVDGRLDNHFLIVSNICPADPSAVIHGNERVVRPRLADARFFFEQDKKHTLESRLPALDKVVYHNRLGSMGERSRRVAAIANAIGVELGSKDWQAEYAAKLAKADLLTGMVGEFPELQGVMGRYYALSERLSPEIADAIEDHYKPRFAGDALPRGIVGEMVALADKMETLVGLFRIGQVPTGDKDPFALRRHALGVARILMEGRVTMSFVSLLKVAADSFKEMHDDGILNSNSLQDFIYERLAGYLREQGYTAQEVDAVRKKRPWLLASIPKRLAAVRAFSALPEAAALAAANKRIGNILKKRGETTIPLGFDPNLLKEDAEIALARALDNIKPKADAAFDAGDYTGSLKILAALRAPVDDFFDKVMVNTEDVALRANRRALLAHLHSAMNRVADISRLSV